MRAIDLGGQPDLVAVSPDGNYAVVVIEDERDEDLDDGVQPQLPAGTICHLIPIPQTGVLRVSI